VVDDMSADFSCYGETLIRTPHVDRLAREGTRFAHAFVTAPVCSPCRSALITGMHQTSNHAIHPRLPRHPRFADAYASSQGTPTRATLLTGQYTRRLPHQSGLL